LHRKTGHSLAGINDIAQNNGFIKLENVMSNIISMSELAKSHKIKVLLCSVLPCDRFSWRPEILPAEEVKRLNGMIKDYASKNKMGYVDYYTSLANETGGLSKELSDDGCHPKFNCYTTRMFFLSMILKTVFFIFLVELLDKLHLLHRIFIFNGFNG
jgi:hypothetical protein